MIIYLFVICQHVPYFVCNIIRNVEVGRSLVELIERRHLRDRLNFVTRWRRSRIELGNVRQRRGRLWNRVNLEALAVKCLNWKCHHMTGIFSKCFRFYLYTITIIIEFRVSRILVWRHINGRLWNVIVAFYHNDIVRNAHLKTSSHRSTIFWWARMGKVILLECSKLSPYEIEKRCRQWNDSSQWEFCFLGEEIRGL